MSLAADGFRATISGLRSLDGSKRVSFHTICLPDNCCLRLLTKNFDRKLSEDVASEEVEVLSIHLQAVLQLCFGLRDQNASNTRPLNPHFILSVARGHKMSEMHSLTKLCRVRVSVETYIISKGPYRGKRFRHTQRNRRYAPQCVACGKAHLSVECSTQENRLKVLQI